MIAATNRPDILDPALLRPGRFDRQISVDLPDLEGRKAVFRVHAKGKPIGPDVDLDVAARGTPGMSGADIANLLNEAALIAARRNKNVITQSELEAATDRVMMGPEKKSRVMPAKELELTAYHEAGHAIVGHVLEGCDPVHKVTIIPRGRALGVTISLPTEDRYSYSFNALRDRLAMALGGRSAEELIYGIANVTTGAANDLENATSMGRRMVMKFGFSDEVGLVSLGDSETNPFGFGQGARANYSGQTASVIDNEVRELMDGAHRTAMAILTAHRDLLERFTRELIAKETLERDDINELFKDLPKWDTPEPTLTKEPAFIEPTATPAEPELVGSSRRVGAFSKVRNRAGRAIKGAKDGLLNGDDDVTPPKAPAGVRPRPRPQGSPT
jgi:cell division protease FtsH